MQQNVKTSNMEPNSNPSPQTPGENSVWTVDGSQQQLAPTVKGQSDAKLRVFTNTSKRRLEAFLIFTIFLISILAIALCVTVYLVVEDPMCPNVCSSPNCLRTASALLVSVNESQDPCNDFYNFVCGNFRIEHAMPEPYWQNNWFSIRDVIMRRDIKDYIDKQYDDDDPMFLIQVKDFYRACLDLDAMNKNGLETFWEVLNKTDLPKDPISNPMTSEDWLRSLAKVQKFVGVNLIVGIIVAPSINNSLVNQILVSTPSQVDVMLPGFNWDFDKSKKIIQKMINGEEDDFQNIWVEQGGKMMEYVIESSGGQINESEIKESLVTLLSLTRNFSQFESSPNISKSILNEVPEDITFEELQIYLDNETESGKSKLDIKSFISTIYEDEDIKIDFKNDKLLVHQKYYFRLISNFLEATDDKDIGLYIWWNILYSLAPHINEDLSMLKTRFVSKMLGDYPIQTRSSVCLETVSRLMSPAAGYFMVNKTQKSTLKNVQTLINNIREVFEHSIVNLPWMDRATIKSSVDKLWKIKTFIGIPSIMEDEEELENMYNITLQSDSHLENVMTLIGIQSSEMFASLATENDLDKSNFNPIMINAYYDPSTNSITVPAGILQFPFYNLGAESLHYGAIGTIIGHELTHGFDNIGRMYDSLGNVNTWWSKSSIDQYKNRTHCFEDEYSNFVVPLLNTTLDGKYTLAENLADDGGIKFAYGAYKRHVGEGDAKPPGLHKWTHDQLFFMSFANIWCSETAPSIMLTILEEDEHSPDVARVNVVLQNFEPFSKAWNCPKGSGMNPEKKCKMWG